MKDSFMVTLFGGSYNRVVSASSYSAAKKVLYSEYKKKPVYSKGEITVWKNGDHMGKTYKFTHLDH